MRQTLLLSIVFVLLFALYVFQGTTILDPDFGWHIRVGEYILMHGFAYTDPFSYTMPGYLFVDHEWLTNVIWARTLSIMGYAPLVIFYALFAVVAILLQCTLTIKKWLLLPVILVGVTLVDAFGVRTQVVDWVLLSLLLVVLWNKAFWRRWSWFLPLLFLLWANIHGGFGIGLGVFAVILATKSIEERKDIKKNALLLIVCVLVTLFNPFGIRLWGEFWNQLTDTQLHLIVNEWYPAIFVTNFAFWFYVVLSAFLIIRNYKRFPLSILVIYCLLFVAAMATKRNIPIFAIASLYPTIKGIEYLYEEAGTFKFGNERFVKGYYAFIAVSLLFLLPQLSLLMYSISRSSDKQAGYPVDAAMYLQKHLPAGNIMTAYGWGGFLLWKLPEKKDFIDGRMPSWKNPNAPENESRYALGEYQTILVQKEPFSTAVSKYGIDTLLVSVNDLQEKPFRIFGVDIVTNPLLHFLFGQPPLTFSKVVSQVRHMGWREVYHDQTAVVFEK